MLLFPAASVNVLAATSIVANPSASGVNVAVYTVEDVAAKSLKAPLVTAISPTAKSVVDSLGRKDKWQSNITGGRTTRKDCSNLSDLSIIMICNIHIAAAV